MFSFHYVTRVKMQYCNILKLNLHQPVMTLELQNTKCCAIMFSSALFFSILPKSGLYFCLHNSEKVTHAFISSSLD